MGDRASKAKGLAWALAAVALGTLIAVGLAPLAHAVPLSWERRLGAAIGMDAGIKACTPSPRQEALLKKLVARVHPLDPAEAAHPLTVRVVRDPVVNAYAGLGGTITLNSGLLAKAASAEELAGVLAHEIEHVRHRHVMEGILVHLFSWEGLRLIAGGGSAAGLIQAFLRMDFTKAQEAQADEAGLKRLQAGHVDTRGLGSFFARMKRDSPGTRLLSDHPDDDDRIKMAEAYPTAQPLPILTRAEWADLRAYGCGP